MSTKKILMVVNNPAFFLSHRLNIAQAAQAQGYQVVIATMAGQSVQKIKDLGFEHFVIPMSRSGMNPKQELHTIYALYQLFKKVQPDLVHLVTIKAVLYGGIAARMAKVPAVVFAISGLGYLFTRQQGFHPAQWITRHLYRLALAHKHARIIVQNQNDAATLKQLATLDEQQIVLIKGSGVDLDLFKATPEPALPPLKVVMAARLLKDKGVQEYVQAAQLSAQQEPALEWQLAGALDPGNPSAVTAQELANYQQHIHYLGEVKDMAALYQNCHIAVLPSYREGLPKSLIEAGACARAIVTTDVPGCRDAIIAEQTGLLVPAKNATALFQAVQRLANDHELRQRFGKAGRQLAETVFDEQKIVSRQIEIYRDLLTS
ncbi:glycosyltransferase family 4 protein [Brackiella oedipodis]|uniref:glycosyltransferase family 4 protein n=1 Tax=Brackiella oedipodis TaxID=124225 RepID=UPI0004917140|nr:glycosyltransferase family 4 protein [Brackiella oedipodis]